MVSRELPIAVAGRAVVDHDANSNAGPLTKDSVLDNDDARTPSMSGWFLQQIQLFAWIGKDSTWCFYSCLMKKTQLAEFYMVSAMSFSSSF